MDPVVVEVVANQLLSVAEEMTAVMVRSAYSPAIRDRRDCSSVLLTANGDTFAQAADIPIHIGAMNAIVDAVRRDIGYEALHEADVFVSNDPYIGASTHLNDLTFIAPIVLEGEVVAFACVTAHHSDIGGMAPGSENPEATSIFQEGIRLPLLRVHGNDGLLAGVFELVGRNSRTPDERTGDMQAQLGAVLRGRARLMELVARYGWRSLTDVIEALLGHTEARFRSGLGSLPDGSFAAIEELDAPRTGRGSVQIAVRVTKRGESVRLDFDGTSPQLAEGRNVPYAALSSTVHYALRSLVDPELPANSGFFRAVEISAPPGCVVNAVSPAPVSSRVSTCQHIANAIFKAVAPAWTDRVIAGCDGRRKVILSGVDPRTGKFFVYHEHNAGGVGAHANGDGIDGAMAHVVQIVNMPAEALELAFPIVVERLEILCDSGGAGRWRGGAGIRRDYRVLSGPVECTLQGERSKTRMWGLAGGASGAPGQFVLNPGRSSERVIDTRKRSSIVLQTGDVISVQTRGSGGFGDPHERPVNDVVRDVQEGRISAVEAKRSYGVRVAKTPDGNLTGERTATGPRLRR